ncbi:hypothetical protein GQ457_03G017740 [Hibiscus cannabinus]
MQIASSGKQGSKGDRVKPLFKYGFCDYGSVNKQWGGYALFREREGTETFREGFETFSMKVPKPCPKVSIPLVRISILPERVVYQSWTFRFDSGIPRVTISGRFYDWTGKEYVIKEHVPNEPGTNDSRANKHKFKKHMDDILDVGCLVLVTMTPELQKQREYMVAYEMIQNLKEILKGQHNNRGMRPLRLYFNAK